MSHDAGHHHDEHQHEPVGYGQYFLTWFSLLGLTAITVTAAGARLTGCESREADSTTGCSEK